MALALRAAPSGLRMTIRFLPRRSAPGHQAYAAAGCRREHARATTRR